MNFQELCENLLIELNNLGYRLEANIGNNSTIELFKTDVYNLCESKKFNVLLKDIERMASYKKLINSTSEADVDYVKDTIKHFYKEYIESLKEELY